jgi:hypothetical protein
MTATNDIRQTFFQECDELLEALNDERVKLGKKIQEVMPLAKKRSQI